MSALLVSVRSPREAAFALLGGASVIDIKEPLRGPLGRADPKSWKQVVARVAGASPVSVALGELADYKPIRDGQSWTGIGYAKLGLAGLRDRPRWNLQWDKALATLPSQVRAVAVVYADSDAADSPAPADIIRHAAQIGCWGILFDTYGKRNGNLFDCIPSSRLAHLLKAIREYGMAVALAGSLDPRGIEMAMKLKPNLVAVRSAACRGGRNGLVNVEKVRRLAQIVTGGSRK